MGSSNFDKLRVAFDTDGYDIETEIEYPAGTGRYGIRAKSREAINYDTQKPKLAFYLEGTPYEMGYQMGYLAESEIGQMTTTFVEMIPVNFIDPHLPKDLKEKLGEIIDKWLDPNVKKLAESDAIPQEFKDQIRGILDGCQKANPDTQVTLDGLQLLNYGIDVICSIVYEGSLPQKYELSPSQFKLPMMCNAFSLSGDMVEPGNHFFGRDFMFDTGDVFQNTACLIVYNPDCTFNGIQALPSVVQTAPGMVGSIVGINKNGMAMGVDMSPSHACDPDNPGLNSLLLVRHSVQYGKDADAAVNRIREAKRGVSWLYPFADGSTGKAGVVETIKSIDYDTKDQLAKFFYDIPFDSPKFKIIGEIFKIYLAELKRHLPDSDFIKANIQQFNDLKNGIFPRLSTYDYPSVYLENDTGLWKCYNDIFKLLLGYKHLHDNALDPDGYIDRVIENSNATFKIEKNCPGPWYFAPLRKQNPGKVLVSNHFITPEMRYTSMHWWSALLLLLTNEADDIQWRYDALSKLIDEARLQAPISKKIARWLIDFLNPLTGPFPGYYANNPRSSDGKEIRIHGSVSLCDLKAKSIESHFGYYCDKWITISLPHYID